MEFKEIVLQHYKKYPCMQIQDFFKLAYQSTFGPFHLKINKKDCLKYIYDEYKNVSSINATLIEDIGNNLCRVYLDCLKEEQINDLAEIFIKSCKKRGTGEEFKRNVNDIRGLIINNKININLDDFDVFYKKYVDSGCPTLSHSEIYKEKYHPHYRVVDKNLLNFLIK